MLIDSFMPTCDAAEAHSITIDATIETVYEALWTVDFGGSVIVKFLLLLRAAPGLIARGFRPVRQNQKITIQNVIKSGFGLLAETPPQEIVLGVTGKFWRPVGNLAPFERSDFDQPLSPGLARAVWNFHISEATNGRTTLRTETRITCGDGPSRRKFLSYWLIVRPFSGLIRLIMLRRIRNLAEQMPRPRHTTRPPGATNSLKHGAIP